MPAKLAHLPLFASARCNLNAVNLTERLGIRFVPIGPIVEVLVLSLDVHCPINLPNNRPCHYKT
jgi:hypothetical protein